jgi:hypothetical protein
MNTSTQCHTPAAFMRVLINFCMPLLPFTTKTTDDAVISPFCLLCLMVRVFPSHCTWVGIATP